MSEKAIDVQRKTFKHLQKCIELLLKTTLKDYMRVWIIGSKIDIDEWWIKTFTLYCMH